jgi:nucleoside-diphosphate-sugar epimerase
MPPDILVTGASGFVGRALCARLAGAGLALRGAVRTDPSDAPNLGCPCVRVGDIGPDTDWTQALQGIAVVIHLAARAHVMDDHAADPLAAYRRVNVAGTETLARQAVAANVRRIVFLSSIKVNGEACDAPGFNEADPPRPQDAYGISKLEAERRLAAILAASHTDHVILRPPLVYGPGVKGNLARLIRLVDRGVPLPLAAIDNRRSLVGIDNLVAAIDLVTRHPGAANGTFLVSDDEPVSSADLVRAIAGALGRPARLVPVPAALLRLAGRMSGRDAAVARLTSSLVVDSRAIRARLGYRTVRDFADGIRAMEERYRNEKS